MGAARTHRARAGLGGGDCGLQVPRNAFSLTVLASIPNPLRSPDCTALHSRAFVIITLLCCPGPHLHPHLRSRHHLPPPPDTPAPQTLIPRGIQPSSFTGGSYRFRAEQKPSGQGPSSSQSQEPKPRAGGQQTREGTSHALRVRLLNPGEGTGGGQERGGRMQPRGLRTGTRCEAGAEMGAGVEAGDGACSNQAAGEAQ